MSENIFRNATIAERQDFKVIGEQDWKRVCDDKLREIQQKYTALHKPFDYACARLDVHDRVRNLVVEVSRVNPLKDTTKYIQELGIDWDELEKMYSDPERFTKIGTEKEEKEPSLLNKRFMETVGFTHFYACKQRGHKFGIYVPIQELHMEGDKVVKKQTKN